MLIEDFGNVPKHAIARITLIEVALIKDLLYIDYLPTTYIHKDLLLCLKIWIGTTKSNICATFNELSPISRFDYNLRHRTSNGSSLATNQKWNCPNDACLN